MRKSLAVKVLKSFAMFAANDFAWVYLVVYRLRVGRLGVESLYLKLEHLRKVFCLTYHFRFKVDCNISPVICFHTEKSSFPVTGQHVFYLKFCIYLRRRGIKLQLTISGVDPVSA